MAEFKITPSTSRQSKGEKFELITDSQEKALAFAVQHMPADEPEYMVSYATEVLEIQLGRMEVGDALTECWSMAVFSQRIERIS